MSQKYTGKAGMGGSNDFTYAPDYEAHRVKPRQSRMAIAQEIVFYGLSLLAIIGMVLFVLGH